MIIEPGCQNPDFLKIRKLNEKEGFDTQPFPSAFFWSTIFSLFFLLNVQFGVVLEVVQSKTAKVVVGRP